MSATTGIGASIAPSAAGGFEVLSLSATGNASKHLVVGDRILSIGAVATTGLSDAAVKALILGPAGSTISMVGPLHNAETTAEVSYTFTCSFSFFFAQVVVRGAINKPISFSRNAASVPTAAAATAPTTASAPVASKVPVSSTTVASSARPPLGLTLVPAQGACGVKVGSVTPGGLAATTGH